MANQRNYIVAAALRMEVYGLEHIAPLVYTGVGKINAVIGLYAAVLNYKPDLVVNFGTAGALKKHKGLVKVDSFVQHDIDARPLGFERGKTPYSDSPETRHEGVVLGSGDKFITNGTADLEGLPVQPDLVDMEGYAMYRVCRRLGVEFVCYKYVSDAADEEAADDWQARVSAGTKIFSETLLRSYGKSALVEPSVR